MQLQDLLKAVLIKYETKLGKSSDEMRLIQKLITNNTDIANVDFDIDNANSTLQVISQVSGFGFSILKKLPIPHLADVLSDNLAEFVKKHHQELFPGTSIDNAADLVFKMFLLVYFETNDVMKNITVLKFLDINESDLLTNE
ncbi:MAG: hypothetical protein ACNFW9_04105 [Candidatus Kerfeldbacteria bacterium]